LVNFSRFGMLYREKSGNPAPLPFQAAPFFFPSCWCAISLFLLLSLLEEHFFIQIESIEAGTGVYICDFFESWHALVNRIWLRSSKLNIIILLI
jgi:hypothetical protein